MEKYNCSFWKKNYNFQIMGCLDFKPVFDFWTFQYFLDIILQNSLIFKILVITSALIKMFLEYNFLIYKLFFSSFNDRLAIFF